jgi:hypothetical protein
MSNIGNGPFIGSNYPGDCPYCGQYIMVPNNLHESCPSCFKTIYIYNGNFLTDSEYKNGEKLIYFIEEITDKIIQEVTEEEYKRWILTRTEFNKRPKKQIAQEVDKKRGGAGTIPKYHIKYYLEYMKQVDDYYLCKLCEFIGETPRSKEKVKNHLIKYHLIKISLIQPKIKDNKKPKIRHFLKPWQDPESLFCDTKFLQQFLGKEPAKGNECK